MPSARKQGFLILCVSSFALVVVFTDTLLLRQFVVSTSQTTAETSSLPLPPLTAIAEDSRSSYCNRTAVIEQLKNPPSLDSQIYGAFIWSQGFVRLVGLPCHQMLLNLTCQFDLQSPRSISNATASEPAVLVKDTKSRCSAVCVIPPGAVRQDGDVQLQVVNRTKRAGNRLTFSKLGQFRLCPLTSLPWVYLAAFTKVKNEGLYLAEWIEHLLLIGVQRLYIYDNNSTDDTPDVLLPYQTSGLVVVVSWPWSPADGMEDVAMADALHRFGHLSAWLLSCDVDEFPIPLQHDSLLPTLRRYDGSFVGALKIYHFRYGPNGHEKRPDGLVLESYTRRCFTTAEFKRRYPKVPTSRIPWTAQMRPWKMLIQTRNVQALGIHNILADAGLKMVNLDWREVRLNHYYTKSAEDWALRTMRLGGGGQKYNATRVPNYNDIEDMSGLRLVPQLKQRLAARRVGLLRDKVH